MKSNLNNAPLFLLAEALEGESSEQIFAALGKRYDPRLNDDEWGLLYQIGPRFQFEERIFYQIQTYAGSLAVRMMVDIWKKELDRNILIGTDVEGNFDLLEASGESRSVKRTSIIRVKGSA
jgi:hypothetical protein